MATDLGDRYPPFWEGYPPRMSSEDEKIWRRYLPSIHDNTLGMYFDVGLGAGASMPPGTSPEMAAMWKFNTQKRADVVLETPESWIIVELRFNASSTAIGRLAQYGFLWEQEPVDGRKVRLRLVSNVEDRDLRGLAEKTGIEYIVV